MNPRKAFEQALAEKKMLSRFEEGKPADPTENMNPEDAKKWWEEHEKNKDNFKTAATYPALRSVASKDCKLIERLVSQRMEVDWITDPRDERYKEESKKEGFLEYVLPRVKEQFDEVNDLIREATNRVLRRLIAFEKAGLPEFEELGYDVKVGKILPLFAATDWADYSFKQDVSISDKVFGGATTLDLTWGFRGYVSMSEKGQWTNYSSDSSDGHLTFAMMMLIIKDRQHKVEWPKFTVWRKQKMTEKGL
jgi:hypothetical protein